MTDRRALLPFLIHGCYGLGHLAPKLVEQVGELPVEIARRGVSILLVEQKLAIALKISARLYVMGHGKIVFQGTPADFGENSAVRREWLEV